jgi:uncharacterized protein YfkK (UPF0435 family)
MEDVRDEAATLLIGFYKGLPDGRPVSRTKMDWLDDNKRGFFMGLIQVGRVDHVNDLLRLLRNDLFKEQQEFSRKDSMLQSDFKLTFIDEMFSFYIERFHKGYFDAPIPQPVSNEDVEGRVQQLCEESDPMDQAAPQVNPALARVVSPRKQGSASSQQRGFQNQLKKRDDVCLFCWDNDSLEGAHIIAQKKNPVANLDAVLLRDAGVAHKYHLQNGLLLCKNCHDKFDLLKSYVDFIDDKPVLKIVNKTNDPNDFEHSNNVEKLKDIRRGLKSRNEKFSNREVTEANGELGLYFMSDDAEKLPSRKALEFHRTACLIWRMAGGAEPADYDDYDEDEENDYEPIIIEYTEKNIKKWQASIEIPVAEPQK